MNEKVVGDQRSMPQAVYVELMAEFSVRSAPRQTQH